MKKRIILNQIYEHDKYDILNNLKYVSETIIKRLFSTFESIEQEANDAEKVAYEKSSQFFNPETMDETFGMDEAYHEGVEHYIIHNEMKNEFLNSSITWLFHLFEKDCNRVFITQDGKEKKRIIESLGIDTSTGSQWSKCNSELRLIANTIKHGKGSSSRQLKSIKPNYFVKNILGVSDDKIQITIDDIEYYIENIKGFWVSFFNSAIPTSEQ